MRPRSLIVGLGLALCLTALGVSAQQLYRWVDENGQVHYSDQPPPETAREAETIEVDAEISPERQAEARRRLVEQRQALAARRETRDQSEAEVAQEAAERQRRQEARDRLCAQARQNLRTLIDQGPVFRLNEAGERVFLDDSQRDNEIARYREVVSQACSQAPR